MEQRSINITIDKAKKWYNSDNADLKELALQVFTIEDLTTPDWQNIKTFEDAYKALCYNKDAVENMLASFETSVFCKQLAAIYKICIIRKALNGSWKPNLNDGDIFYPVLVYLPVNDELNDIVKDNHWKIKCFFIANKQKYALIITDMYGALDTGMNDNYSFNEPNMDYAMFCCKSPEIAQHMDKYFTKEIFEACYAQHTSAYRWCD